MSRKIEAGWGFALVLALSTAYAASEGTLTVKTNPEGVEVWLNNSFLGDSPIDNKKVKAGRYTLKLVDPIQQTSTSEDIFIEAGQATVIEKSLKTKFGTLRVTTDPEGAQVSISTVLGKTPYVNNFMNPGKYLLEIKPVGKTYVPLTHEVIIPRGETINVTKTLEKRTPFTTKALLRLGLGVVSAAGYSWAIIEQGNYKRLEERGDIEAARAPRVKRVLGIIIGSTALTGLEIVAFF